MAARKTRLPLTALRTFEAAARRLSFKEAAEELFVSPTTVSNQIRELEKNWGCALFIRKTRAIVLTDEGRSLSVVLQRAFSDIRAEIDTHITPASRSVKLAVGPIFGARWLIPRLADFRERHPTIELVLDHSPRITSVESLTSHLAVDWGTGEWDGLDVTPLFPVVYAPVVNQDLIARYGELRHPSDLARYPIIHQRDRGEWNAWLRVAGQRNLEPAQETVIMDSNIAVQAAIDGQGVALGAFPFLNSDVEAGRLVRPFDIDLIPERSYYLLSRHSARRSSEIDNVCAWLIDNARQFVEANKLIQEPIL
ncbi:hypothetical protein AB833_13745 [Chromatiales bacterium (ex Bugula neritina AB1)]|nr:hypothetical protein AB833_13745 [Chromatiales bacterium (ex Bugula neritina AB1)]